MIISILFSLLFSSSFAEIFILNLQLKSVDRYVSSLKYQSPLASANANDSSVASAILLYNDEDNVASEVSLRPSEYLENVTSDITDNETRAVIDDMYIENYHFNSSEYFLMKDL